MECNNVIRKARVKDIDKILELIHNDILRTNVELKKASYYYEQFENINNDRNNFLFVVENNNADVIGTFQITTLHYLFQNETRFLVEYVRVEKGYQRQQIGTMIFIWIESFARKNNVKIIQLTSHKKRNGALMFYRKLGFTKSHFGFKKYL